MKWKRTSTVALLALFAWATGLIGTASGDQATDHPRPFKVSMEFTGSAIGPLGSFGCDPASLPLELVGSGQATHMGRIAVDGFVCNSPETGAFTHGAATYAAASGDRVDVAFAGQAFPEADGAFTGEGSLVVLGGTGRFASATGAVSWTLTGVFLPDGRTLSDLGGAGRITYDASDRSG